VTEDVIIPILIPLIFYVFIGTIILVPVTLHYRNKLASHKLVHEAIARGQQLDPALIERLVPPAKPYDPRNVAFGFLVPGVIFGAIGAGLAFVAAFLTTDTQADFHNSLLTGAVITGSIGLGFIIIAAVAFVLFKRPKE
jgi:hypothetical protein